MPVLPIYPKAKKKQLVNHIEIQYYWCNSLNADSLKHSEATSHLQQDRKWTQSPERNVSICNKNPSEIQQQQLFLVWLVVSRVSAHILPFKKGSYIPWVDLQSSRCIGSEMLHRHPQHRLQIKNTPLASEGQTDPSSWAQWGSVVQFVTLAEKDHSQHVPNGNSCHNYWTESYPVEVCLVTSYWKCHFIQRFAKPDNVSKKEKKHLISFAQVNLSRGKERK